MASFGEDYFNTSVVDTSSIQDGDYDMFLDCLEELCKSKKTDDNQTKPMKKSKRSKNQENHNKAVSSPAHLSQSIDSSRISSNKSQSQSVSRTANPSANNSCVSISDISANITGISDQFSDIFAYFDEDVTSSEIYFDELSNEISPSRVSGGIACEKENISQNVEKLVSDDIKPKVNYSTYTKTKASNKNADAKHIQSESVDILKTIEKFNSISRTNDKTEEKMTKLPESPKMRSDKRLNRTVDDSNRKQRPTSCSLSTASTLSLHSSDNDAAVFKKPFDVLTGVNVKSKIAFFTDSSTDRSSSTSPSIPSDDDEFVFKRTESKRNFDKNRNFFENYFKVKHDDEKTVHEKQSNELQSKYDEQSLNERNSCKQNPFVAYEIDANEKLKAVQTYVQTQYLLERIQRLVVAISNLDENRMSSMNLKLLKKFLTFIRDCSYSCTEVCYDISEHFLTDFEKNVMSAEELLYSALKMAHAQQVHKTRNTLRLF